MKMNNHKTPFRARIVKMPTLYGLPPVFKEKHLEEGVPIDVYKLAEFRSYTAAYFRSRFSNERWAIPLSWLEVHPHRTCIMKGVET